jgi:hypothetical protein
MLAQLTVMVTGSRDSRPEITMAVLSLLVQLWGAWIALSSI